MKKNRFILILALLGLVVLVGWAADRVRNARAAPIEYNLRTAQVEPADFHVSIRVSGSLEAVRTNPVVSGTGGTGGRGVESPRIVWMLDDGSWVEEGDIIIRIDAAQAEQQVRQLEVQVAEAEERVRAAYADGERRVQNQRASFVKAEESLQLARTQNQAAIERAQAEVAYQEKELEVAVGELEKRQRLAEERLVPQRDVESAEDEVRQREFSLEQARLQLDRAESDAAMVERLRLMDIEKAELEVEQAEASLIQSVNAAERTLDARQTELDEALLQLSATEVRALASGLLLLARERRGEPIRIGDEVREQQRLADVIDPAELWVRCDISEAEIEEVAVDQKASVLIPALGNITLPGRVAAIDNLARERMWWEGGVAGKKVFAALIELTEHNERLRPGMGASIEIKLDQVNEGVALPVEALFGEGPERIVYRQEGDNYRPVTVELIGRNDLYAAVKGGLDVGDIISCELPPASFISNKENAR